MDENNFILNQKYQFEVEFPGEPHIKNFIKSIKLDYVLECIDLEIIDDMSGKADLWIHNFIKYGREKMILKRINEFSPTLMSDLRKQIFFDLTVAGHECDLHHDSNTIIHKLLVDYKKEIHGPDEDGCYFNSSFPPRQI